MGPFVRGYKLVDWIAVGSLPAYSLCPYPRDHSVADKKLIDTKMDVHAYFLDPSSHYSQRKRVVCGSFFFSLSIFSPSVAAQLDGTTETLLPLSLRYVDVTDKIYRFNKQGRKWVSQEVSPMSASGPSHSSGVALSSYPISAKNIFFRRFFTLFFFFFFLGPE